MNTLDEPPNKVDAPRSVDVISVTYNCRDIVRNCLTSLSQTIDERFNIWVVDNASTDGTVEMIRSEFPSVSVIARKTNDGFGVANNSAIVVSHGEWVLLLNPDTEVDASIVDRLVAAHGPDPRCGMIGCRLLQLDGVDDHAAKRSFPTPALALRYFLARDKSSAGYLRPDLGYSEVGEVDAINGAFMLIRRSALESVGGFDDRFWMYAEDLDLCRRFWDAGWKVVYDGTERATHLKSALTGKKRSPKLNWHFHRSMALYYLKHRERIRPVFDAVVVVGIMARMTMKIVTDGVSRARGSWGVHHVR